MVTEKKTTESYAGMSVNQKSDKATFVKNYLNWKKTCTDIKSSDMMVEGIPTLYDFLVNHITSDSIRGKSRNQGHTKSGANKYITIIDSILQKKFYTISDEIRIVNFGKVLWALKGSGKDVEESPALDPGFILFTEKVKGKQGEDLSPKIVQGHYRTEAYAKKNNTSKAPASWFTGTNLPHKALFSEEPDSEFGSKGLAVLMKEAEGQLDDILNEIDDVPLPEDEEAIRDWEEVKDIEAFFNKVIKNPTHWSKDGRLLVAPLRREFENTPFKLTNQDQEIIRSMPKMKAKEAPAGHIHQITLSSSPLTIVILVDHALKRKNTTKAPNGFPAWQNTVKTGFDYREAGQEDMVFPVSGIRIAKELAKIPEIKRFVQSLLKRTALYDGPNFQTSNAAKLLLEKNFNFSPTSKTALLNLFRKEKANPKSIKVKLTKNAMKALLNQSVISRTKDLQSMNAPNTDEKIVLKGMWQSLLWR